MGATKEKKSHNKILILKITAHSINGTESLTIQTRLPTSHFLVVYI